MQFENASTLKAWLKEQGVGQKLKVKRWASPFTGATRFEVKFADAAATVRMMTSQKGIEGDGFAGDFAAERRRAQELLYGIRANAYVS